ncbi:hypothetical protein CEXT_637121 [Caerostris extrusa]|uniref:Uncharacterized protein n=1 Tax=Caerostris extrusa TaxID=172846 RepID=A0AAV4TCV9_CAEEX|nr:hypothetical protein CEXT_637121 [Caerostris extrusa]
MFEMLRRVPFRKDEQPTFFEKDDVLSENGFVGTRSPVNRAKHHGPSGQQHGIPPLASGRAAFGGVRRSESSASATNSRFKFHSTDESSYGKKCVVHTES